MRFGRPGAPAWVTTLQLAKEWGVTPDQIASMRGGLKWAARLAAYNEQVRKSSDLDAKQQGRKQH